MEALAELASLQETEPEDRVEEAKASTMKAPILQPEVIVPTTEATTRQVLHDVPQGASLPIPAQLPGHLGNLRYLVVEEVDCLTEHPNMVESSAFTLHRTFV